MSSSDKKPGFFQRLFGRSKSSSASEHHHSPSSPSNKKDKPHANNSADANSSRPKPHHPPAAVKLQTQTSAPVVGTGTGRSPTKTSPPVADGANKNLQASNAAANSRQTSRTTGAKRRGSKHRKRGRTSDKSTAVKNIDTSRPLEYPATPEMILAHHQAKRFLDRNEEWLLVELNEYECLVDGLDIIRTIAKHSKFFEVEPDELWEEFFEFVDEIPSYDEVINFDVWQEFRDNKYPC